ncbi:metal ABC transporter ATP-binding protein [Lentilactobacillus senioris]|uniref:ABC transporter-like protein n=1 Tax=Lentilactobacillus senioris DSM 24302 = JCM 17472 TaxID=1423802 RepID=A0A0R2CSJ2_9LACO|nr:ABC transporter ATP-binding protein [Lentilactobacillus senioris]KRM94766.1 ABC transporter-like protein [Lentilactobacillus senioris DSM 24302 = JCM 17472]
MLSVNDLAINFGSTTVFDHLSFQVDQGDFLAVIGVNGVGKTTLIKTILGQLKPTAGTIETNPQLKIGYVPQFRNLDSEYPLTIADFVSLNFTGWKLPWLSKKERQRVQTVIKQLELTPIANRPLGRASGGEKQKAYLAQALVAEPNLLILDESTASLDPTTKQELLRVVKDLNQRLGLTIIFISHDMELVNEYPNKYLWLRSDGYSQGPIAELEMKLRGEADV